MVYRKINSINFAINPSASNEIYFEKEFTITNKITNELAPQDICKLIAKNNYFPMILTWELLDKCNFSCPFCYIVGHSNHKIVRFDKIKTHLETLIKKGLVYCTLTGGEALLHKDFNQIYRFLKESGVIVEIYSNGHLLTKEHLELFNELPPYKIEVSIYGVSQKDFDRATNTKNTNYEVVLNNILLLKKNGINVKCKTPFNSHTEINFDKIKKWCDLNSIDYYYSTNISDAYDGENLNRFNTDYETMISYETDRIINIEKLYPNSFNIFENKGIKDCYTCGVRNYGLHINANFELQICSETFTKESTFNILEDGIENSITKNRDFVNKHMDKPIKGCIGCDASSICKMCPAKAEPKLDENEKVLHFELPDNHCENQRNKYNAIIDRLLK